MAIKILKHGNRFDKVRRFICTSCWCEFEANNTDCFSECIEDGETFRYKPACHCPECGRIVIEHK